MFRVKGGLYLKPFLGVGQILLIMGKTFTLTGEWLVYLVPGHTVPSVLYILYNTVISMVL